MKKLCRQCQTEVRVADFYRARGMTDGRMSICKSCHRSNVRENRTANIDRYREFDRQRANLPHRVAARAAYAETLEGKAALARGSKAWAGRNPLKRKAQFAVSNAIRDGKLTRQPCEQCGERAQAHHDDYSKPLDVRWLCTVHHAEWHKHNVPLCPDQEQAA